MDTEREAQSRTRVSGIDRMLQILDRLQDAGAPASAYDIAKSIKAPLSTVYTIINDLVDKEILKRDNKDGTVWLGARLYRYGLAYARSLDFLTVASQVMRNLAVECGESIQICGRDENMMVVIAMEEGEGHFRVTSRIGTRVPLNWTASGKLLVGHLSEEERIRIFTSAAKPSPTGRAETDPVVLAKAAGEALQQRLSIQIAESDALVACVASPILDQTGNCTATISIVAPQTRVAEKGSLFAESVKRAAANIERRMGW